MLMEESFFGHKPAYKGFVPSRITDRSSKFYRMQELGPIPGF